MGKIIAFVNQKGGVAKTTTVKNVSAGFGLRGKKVLAVDLDPSSGLSRAFGITEEDTDKSGSIADIFNAFMVGEDIEDDFGIVHLEEGIDIIPSSHNLEEIEDRLNTAMQREVLLRKHLADAKEEYDYILLDCPSGLGLLTINALFCADTLIIPVSAQKLSVESMQNLFRKISNVRRLRGRSGRPELLGILFTMIRPNTRNDREIMAQLRRNYDNIHIFDEYVPLATMLPESDYDNSSIFKYAKNSSIAMIFGDLVDELLGKLEA